MSMGSMGSKGIEYCIEDMDYRKLFCLHWPYLSFKLLCNERWGQGLQGLGLPTYCDKQGLHFFAVWQSCILSWWASKRRQGVKCSGHANRVKTTEGLLDFAKDVLQRTWSRHTLLGAIWNAGSCIWLQAELRAPLKSQLAQISNSAAHSLSTSISCCFGRTLFLCLSQQLLGQMPAVQFGRADCSYRSMSSIHVLYFSALVCCLAQCR